MALCPVMYFKEKDFSEDIEKWRAEKEALLASGDKNEEEEEVNIYAVTVDESGEDCHPENERYERQQKLIAHVPVPPRKKRLTC
ncbi:pre-mRNA-splicing factor ISY1 homolog [Aquarana catesbeiana]|uniref:pre-mRNA-splicing factor ISY1 homolog n=1 Tax=Aquarana catesbeiana TaxID=8400 RepID=UPI003CCA6B95